METIRFTSKNHITIPGFAVVELGLSGNELICFSLIYGFCQDGESEFYGSLNYVSSALNVNKENARLILKRLVEKGLLEKKDVMTGGVKYCRYTIKGDVKSMPALKQGRHCSSTRGGIKSMGGRHCSSGQGGIESMNNNIEDNIKDNITDNITQAEVVDEGELRYQKFVDWLTKSAPQLLKLQKTFTKDEFLKLRAEYSSQDIISLCLEMENYKDLTKRYTSAYLTFRSWMKRRKDKTNGTAKTTTSEREQRISQIDEYIAGKYGIDMGRY